MASVERRTALMTRAAALFPSPVVYHVKGDCELYCAHESKSERGPFLTNYPTHRFIEEQDARTDNKLDCNSHTLSNVLLQSLTFLQSFGAK
jgi:hypothetical protein